VIRALTFAALLPAVAFGAATACSEIPFESARDGGGGEGAIVIDPDFAPASADMTLRFTLLVGPSGLVQGGGFRVELPADPVHPFLGFTHPQIEDRWQQQGFFWCGTRRGAREGPRAIASVGKGGEARCALQTGRLDAGDSMTLTWYGLAPRVSGRWRLAAETRYSGGRGGGRVARDPVFTVTPRPARALAAVLPSRAILGDPVTLDLVALDEFGNRATDYRGPVRVIVGDETLAVGSDAFEEGTARVALVPRRQGYLRALVEETEGPPEFRISARSNPAQVVSRSDPDAPEIILWGDPHTHTGTGASGTAFLSREKRAGDLRGNATSQEQAVVYARDVARLDFAAATEYAAPELYPEGWRASAAIAAQHDGRGSPPFTMLRGLAWRDRLVLFADWPSGTIVEDSRLTDDVDELRRAFHEGGLFVEVLLDGARPRERDSGFEIYSWLNRGTAYDDAPRRFEPTPAWLGGANSICPGGLATLAGSANHWGRPGTIDRTGLEPGAGGLTAVVATGRSEREILLAFGAGETWATTGPRIILRVVLDLAEETFQVEAAGVVALARVDLVLVERTGVTETPLGEAGVLDLSGTFPMPHPPGQALWYVRATQSDGAIAWSSIGCITPGTRLGVVY